VKEGGAADRLQRTWYTRRPTLLAILLMPLAWLFGGMAALRRFAYRGRLVRSVRLPVPVIVVGNITVGGTGKTPLVRALVEALRARARRPGVVSRGHGRRTRAARAVAVDDDPRDVGDEPSLLASSGAPVWVGVDRVAAARGLLAAHPDVDVVIADDGLQHYALGRDVELAVIDAARGLGNRLLLPAGPLREPPSRLAAVDAIVWLASADTVPAMRRDRHEFAMTQQPLPWRNLVDPALAFDAAVLADAATVAIAGIADPARFFAAVRAQGFRGVTRAFPDHHAYTRDELAFRDAPAILMTEKDAVKCRAFADARMWMMPIHARVDPALVDFIMERIDGSEAPRNARLSGHEGAAHP
jgi:tetraacyldisaccharide 4'-kinase